MIDGPERVSIRWENYDGIFTTPDPRFEGSNRPESQTDYEWSSSGDYIRADIVDALQKEVDRLKVYEDAANDCTDVAWRDIDSEETQ